MSTSCLDIHLDIDSEGRVRIKLKTKHMISFSIVNVTFICSNIPAEPAFGVYISQLMVWLMEGCSNLQ
jgi:hypothetical protein